MRILTNRKPLFTSWLVSYIVILAFPVALSVIIYFVSVDVITDKIVSSNCILQKQLTQVLDEKIGDADILQQQISNNTSLEDFLMSNQPYSNIQRYNIYLTLKDFGKYMGTNSVVEDFYVYTHATGDIITPTALYDPEITFNQFHSQTNMQQDEWLAYLKQFHQRTIRVFPSENGESMIMMIFSIPNHSVYSPKATIVMFINPDSLLHSIQEMPFAEGTTMLLLDADDQVILSNRDVEVTKEIEYEALLAQPDVFTSTVAGEKTLVLQSTSASTEWKYVTLVSVRSIVESIRSIQVSTLVCCTVSLIFGMFLAYRFSLKRYLPVHRIIKKIGVSSPDSIQGNEYDYIGREIDRIMENSEHFQVMFQKQKEFIQNSYMSSLMQGNITSLLSSNDDLLSILGFSFQSDLFAVIVFSAERASESRDGIDEILRQLISPQASVYAVTLGDHFVCMLNFSSGTEATKAYAFLREKMQHMLSLLDGRPADGLAIGISRMYRGMDMIPIAYNEAIALLTYHAYEEGEHRVITFEDTKDDEQLGYVFTPLQEKTMITSLCAGSAADACKILDSIYQNSLWKSHGSLNLSRCLMFDIASTVVKASKNNDVTNKKVIDHLDQSIGKLWYCRNIEEMYTVLRGLLTYTAEKIGIANKLSQKSLLDDILKYVHDHYSDLNFNVSRLADLMSMNLSYISKFFKNNTGIGLHTYINQVRINAAKKLLDETNEDINDILHQVGFENANSFIRVFKKFVGTTPGTYKTNKTR